MESVIEQLPPGARVAVIRLRSLGDCVLTTPALRILKRSRPDLKIGIVVENRFAPVFEGNPDLSAILPPRRRDLLKWKPWLCINLHGGTRSLGLAVSCGAPLRAGFAHYRYSFVHSIRIPSAQQILGIAGKVHTAEHLASAMFYLGCPMQEIPRAELFATVAAPAFPCGSAYAVIHPFASAEDKTWPSRNFVRLGDHLKRELGLEPVFCGAAADDMSPFAGHRRLQGAPLEELKAVLKGARLFIGNDSGPAHMAAAFGVPCVVIFGSSDPEIWAPWKTVSEVLTSPEGVKNISFEAVRNALERLKVSA